MRSFVRTLKYTWPYRWRLAASIVCALLVAALWGVSLGLISPVLTILSTDKNLQQWVGDEIAKSQEAIRKLQAEDLTPHQNKFQEIKDNPDAKDRENQLRRLGHDVAQIEAKISDLRTSVYRYELLNAQVLRHLPQDRFETFVWIVCAVVCCVAVKGVFEFLHESLVGGVMNRSLFDFRNRFFRRAIHQDVRQLTSAGGTTEMMARFTNDMEHVGLGMKILYGRMVAEPLKMVACLVAACLISWQLTLVFVVLVPLSLAALMKISKMMRRAARKVLERMSAIYKIVSETFTGVRAVKGFTREPHERRRFRRATEEYYRKAMRVVNIDAFANPMIELLGVTAVLLALTAGAYLIVTGSTHIFGMRMTTYPLTFTVLLQLYAFLAATADPIRKMSSVYTKLQVAEAASKRIYELFDRNPSVQPNASGPRIGPVQQGIEFRNVCFSYDPGTEILSNIHLKVKAGETVAIVGGNGCGKTTLLGLLPRFYDPTHGAVYIDGVNIFTAHLRSLRRQVGIVTQDTQLFDDTLFNNIAYGKKNATREEVEDAARKAHAHGFIEKLTDGYDTMMGTTGYRFSGGEKQRIALARAILRDPSILILDEFTSAIDTLSEQEIHAAVKEFVKGAPGDGGHRRTTFLITHRLHTLEIADRIVVMDAGKIVDVGTHAELLDRCDVYQRLHNSAQFRVAA